MTELGTRLAEIRGEVGGNGIESYSSDGYFTIADTFSFQNEPPRYSTPSFFSIFNDS